MLQLLQQRTKLSGKIGAMKRRHGAVIYVPERERELVARLTRLSKGEPSARAVAALYREIMSSSRSAQGQAPIGFLAATAAAVVPAGTTFFGACDRFAPKKSWVELANGMKSGALSLALLTGHGIRKVLASRWRSQFLNHFTVIGDFVTPLDPEVPFGRRIFIITIRSDSFPTKANRVLILIECKSTPNAIKSLLYSMPRKVQSVYSELINRKESLAYIRLASDRLVDGTRVSRSLLEAGKSAGTPVSILGTYPGTEDYGG